MNSSSESLVGTTESRPVIRTLAYAVAVLRYLGKTESRPGVNSIARAVQISPSSCFNILKTLVSEDLVAFEPATKTYSLGLGTVDLARTALSRVDLMNVLRGPMERMADRANAAVGLWRLSSADRLTLIAFSASQRVTRIHIQVGHRQPAIAGAAGRCIAAYRPLSRSETLSAFKKIRWDEAPAFAEYLSQIQQTAKRGWSLDVDQMHRGVTTVGAPILNANGRVGHCLSASTFSGQYSGRTLASLGEEVRELARDSARQCFGLPAENVEERKSDVLESPKPRVSRASRR